MNVDDEKVGPVDTGAQQADVAALAVSDTKPDADKAEDADDESTEQNESGEQATPGESDEGADQQHTERAPLPKGVQRKINKLTRKAGEALLRVQELEQQLAQRDSQVQHTPAAADTSQPDKAPTLEDCNFDLQKHAEATYKWMRVQEQKAEQQAKATTAAQERLTKFAETEEAFAATVPDYYEVSKAPSVPITRAMVEILMENPETAPAIAYHLAKNLTECAAIAQMSPAAAGRAIGRIEASLIAPVSTPSPSRAVTNAPAPVATLKPGAPLRKTLDDLPMDQYAAERDRQLKAKGLRR